jgi:hypothetical protein
MVSTVMRINERKDRMKSTLSVKELAQELGVSKQSIRRAYWTVLSPDIDFTNASLRRGAHLSDLVGTRSRHNEVTLRATAGQGRQRAQPKSPRTVTRGHYPQGSLQEVQGFHEFSLHPHY